jgi:7 transmembrane receptor (rhodopsin family)
MLNNNESDSSDFDDFVKNESFTQYNQQFFNTNYTNFTANVETEGQEEKDNYWALLAIILVIGTACGNILVCLAIAWEKRLQNVTNYFLASLALTDLMVAVLVMPLGILTLFRGECGFFNIKFMKKTFNMLSSSSPRIFSITIRALSRMDLLGCTIL